jgi:hypothetical protein
MIESMLENQKAINSRLTAIEEESDEEPEENNLGKFGAVLEHPAVMPILSAVSGAVVHFLDKYSTPQKAAIAGVEDQNINDVLNLLFSKGVTITHLNKLAQMPESKIKMLIQML